MTEAQIKRFMAHFGAKYNRKKKVYELCLSGCIDIPKDYLKKSKVGRNTLIAILDMVNNAVVEEITKKEEWIRENF